MCKGLAVIRTKVNTFTAERFWETRPVMHLSKPEACLSESITSEILEL